jgi:hypothetical protein
VSNSATSERSGGHTLPVAAPAGLVSIFFSPAEFVRITARKIMKVVVPRLRGPGPTSCPR